MDGALSITPFIILVLKIVLSILLALGAGPVAVFLARKIKAIDTPGSAAHKKHNKPMPLAGGLVMLLTLPILIGVTGLWKSDFFPWLFVGAAVILFFGILDDIYGLSALQKFAGQFLAALILIRAGISVRFLETIHLPLAYWLITFLNWLLTLLWIVGLTNAFNLIDSMDGLVAGLSMISAGFFVFISLYAQQGSLAELSAIIFGLSIGLYFYNRYPARFFLGDSGAQTFGFMLAAIGILYRPPDMSPGSTWFMPILLLGIPIFDTTLVVVSRMRRHKPLFQADLSHTYHRLVGLGMSPGQAVFVIQIVAFLLCVIAFIVMFMPPQRAIFVFLLILLMGMGLIVFFEHSGCVSIDE